MKELTIFDLMLMLQSRGQRPRDHGVNIDLVIKTLYDKEHNQFTSLFGFFDSLTIGVLTVLIKFLSDIPEKGLTDGSIVAIVLLSCSLLALATVTPIVWLNMTRLRLEYVDLVRLYFLTDRSVP